MPPTRDESDRHHDHLPTAGPAVEDHGRVVTASARAAMWYRQAQRAADADRAIAALRLAVTADPAFRLACADLAALTGAAGPGGPAHRAAAWPMTWERHHAEVVRAASCTPRRAADLLREHLAEVGCDPLAVRVTAWLRPSEGEYDAADLPARLPACHAALWPRSP